MGQTHPNWRTAARFFDTEFRCLNSEAKLIQQNIKISSFKHFNTTMGTSWTWEWENWIPSQPNALKFRLNIEEFHLNHFRNDDGNNQYNSVAWDVEFATI